MKIADWIRGAQNNFLAMTERMPNLVACLKNNSPAFLPGFHDRSSV